MSGMVNVLTQKCVYLFICALILLPEFSAYLLTYLFKENVVVFYICVL